MKSRFEHFLLAFSLLILCSASHAQSTGSTPANGATKKSRTVSNLSRRAVELEVSAGSNLSCYGFSTFTGRILRREFDENQVMLAGFVIRDASDVRTYVNIDTDHLFDSDGMLPTKLSRLLAKGKKLKIWAIACENGNSTALKRTLFLNKVDIR